MSMRDNQKQAGKGLSGDANYEDRSCLHGLSEGSVWVAPCRRPCTVTRCSLLAARARTQGWAGERGWKTSQYIRGTSEILRLGSAMRAQVQRPCQHSRCWQADRRLHLVCVRTFFFFFPEDLAGSSIHGNSPRSCLWVKWYFSAQPNLGSWFLSYSSSLGDKGREAHKRRDTRQEGI